MWNINKYDSISGFHYGIQYHFGKVFQNIIKGSFYWEIKELMQFQYIYDKLKNENEMAIAEKYNYNARRYRIVLTSEIIIPIFYKCTHLFS